MLQDVIGVREKFTDRSCIARISETKYGGANAKPHGDDPGYRCAHPGYGWRSHAAQAYSTRGMLQKLFVFARSLRFSAAHRPPRWPLPAAMIKLHVTSLEEV